MPYFKVIGQTPYYVPGFETRTFQKKTARRVVAGLRGIGVDTRLVNHHGGCDVTYLDNLSVYVEQLSRPTTSLLQALTRAFSVKSSP